MVVCKIWDSEYPWDIRAQKVCRSLTAAGHQVHMVARNRRNDPTTEALPEATIHRLAPLPWLGRRLSDASMFPAFFNPRWLRKIRSVVRKVDADLILCRDLPMAPAAVKVGKETGLPVVLDMAENYPAMMREIWLSRAQGISDYLVRNPRIVAAVERRILPQLDHILVVVEESGARLVEMGVPPEKITVVCNTPPAGMIREQEPQYTLDGPLKLIYLGLLEAPRGLGCLIDATKLCLERGIDVSLDVIGDGRERPRFSAQVERLALGERVKLWGYVPNEDAQGMLRKADVGVVPHRAIESWNTTIPNKMFDYMAAGLPVVTSDAIPAARIVREAGVGSVFSSDSAEDLARAIGEMYAPEVRARFGRAGIESVRQRFNWEKDATKMEAALKGVLRSRQGPSHP